MTTFLDEIIKYETVANNGITFASNRFDNAFQPMVVESTAFYESDFGGPLHKFFKSIINTMQNFVRQVTEKINAAIRSKNMTRQLRGFHAQLEQIEKDPTHKKKVVEMIDIEKLNHVITSGTDDLESIHKRLMKNRYRHLKELDKNIKEFNTIYENMEKKYSEIMDKKVKYPVRKAIALIEDEITGRKPLVTALDKCIKSCEEMSRHVDQIQQKRELYGVEVLPAYMSFVKRITTRFTSFIQRGVGKGISNVISGAVFLLA